MKHFIHKILSEYVLIASRRHLKINGNYVSSITCKRHITSSSKYYQEGQLIHADSEYTDGPLKVYHDKVESGELRQDSHQERVIGELQNLHEKLKTYVHGGKKRKSWFWSQPEPQQIKGLYLYGDVGTGKTMLMDLFHNTSNIKNKRRVHFHKFMLDVHDRIHLVKLNQPKLKSTRDPKRFDAIGPVAQQISDEATLLCFDEFQVTDVADAMIVKRLFTGLFKNGVIIVSTSNRHPDDLYKNGLQRGTFLPFIDVLKNNSDIIPLSSGVDYRKLSLPSDGTVYFKGSNTDTKSAIRRVIAELNSTNEPAVSKKVVIKKRDVVFPVTYGRILDSSFDFLCRKNFGAIDYLEISKEFDVVVLRNVPKMNLNSRTEARRFITLIDTLYDNRIKLIMSAEVTLEHLFDRQTTEDMSPDLELMDDLEISAASEGGTASLFTGEEELFAFDRVISRLKDMQSKDYWEGGREDKRTKVRKTS